MDLIKIGKFIAKLRREKNMTQEQLGELLGVTNKTISRWETGSYMPNIEKLQLLSQTFNVSINELIFGEYISDVEFRKKADQNLISITKESAFQFEERKKFWIKKWRKEHISLFLLLIVVILTAIVIPFAINKTYYLGLVPLITFIAYGWQNNKMMIYVEDQLYGKNEK